MKRIIMFVLLFAALKVAGQTTGYLRFDTVKIMKQNGTCELYLINKTKDSLGLLTNIGGGLTQFRRSKMLNDSTFVVGRDTITIHGTTAQGLQSVTDIGNKTTDTIIANGIRTSNILGDTLNQDEYEIDVFPDIQGYTGNSGTRIAPMDSMFNWVVRNRTTENIRAVLQVGDLTNMQANLTEMARADTQFDKLDVYNIPYLPVIGNHDYTNTTYYRNDTGYNQYFGPSRYVGHNFYGGCMDGSNANFFITFEGGGHKYAAIGLEFLPRDTALNWAQKIIDSLWDREIIIVTHAYIARSGERATDTTQFSTLAEYVPDGNNGEQMWQKLIKKNKRIFLVASGHFIYGFGITPPVVKRITDAGIGGNVVYQTVCNYQQDTLSGNGYFMRLKFKPRQGKITVSFYSPYLGYYDARFPAYDLKYPTISIDAAVGVSDNGGGLNVAGEARFDSTVSISGLPKNRFVFTGVNGKLDTIAYQGPNIVLAGPASGSAANPTFRSLVVNDIPLDSTKNILNQNAYPQTGNFYVKGTGVISESGQYRTSYTSAARVVQGSSNVGLSLERAIAGNNPPRLIFYHNRNTDINGKTPSSNGDWLGQFEWHGNRKTDTAETNLMMFTCFARQGSVYTGGELSVWLTDTTTGGMSDRFHINSKGWVRIGGASTTSYMVDVQSGDARFTGNTYHMSNVGIGTTSPSARLHLPAGTTSANTAPFKFTSGPLTTTPEDGAAEYPGTDFYGTVGSSRAIFLRGLKGSTTWQPGTVAAGSSVTTTITVTGAALGDPVTVSKASGAYSNGELYDAFVSAVDTVTIRVHNVSTGSANYNTTETYNVVLLKY